MNLNNAIPEHLPVTSHTDYVGKGSTFVVVKGASLNGLDFIQTALQKGASKIVVQNDTVVPANILDLIDFYKAELFKVPDCRQALTELSARAWQEPAKKLKIIGVTGTKGKTTSTFLLRHILSIAGYKTAMISGVHNMINDKVYPSNLTTPLPDYLHAFFNSCVQENVQFVIMESSAQAFSLRRLHGIDFSGAIFTNLDLEHSEFYSSMEDYFNAKCEIFKQMKSKAPVVINLDNKWCQKIDLQSANISTVSFSNKKSDYFIKIKKNDSAGLELDIKSSLGKYSFIIPNLVGDFNAYNIACVISLCFELGIYPKVIMDSLHSFGTVPGRMERYKLSNGAFAIIDYAHNPSSFSYVLTTMKSMTNKLIVVFGAGGDRDKQKRPIMGNIASSIADQIIITADNPRSEDAQDIANQITSGVITKNKNKILCELDRKKAIEKAYNLSSSGDIIAILGKGPDEYQIIGTQKTYFSDKETILKASKS